MARSSQHYCPLNNGSSIGNVWAEGDILIGGRGSDTIEGRSGDDIIDGDRFLQTRISVRTDPTNPATEIGSTDLMEHQALSGTFGPGTAGMTLQQAVFAGLTDPGDLVAVREIITPSVPSPDCGAVSPVNCDTAVFSGPQRDYVVTIDADNTVHVKGTGASVADGNDTLRNIEQLSFCDGSLVGGDCTVARTIVQPAVTPGPTLSSFTPSTAPTDSQIVLNGTNFTTMSTVTVTFSTAGGTVDAPATVLSPTQIAVEVPASAVSGPVVVANPAGSSSLAFAVTPPVVPPVVPPSCHPSYHRLCLRSFRPSFLPLRTRRSPPLNRSERSTRDRANPG